jgi:hypothetical protein
MAAERHFRDRDAVEPPLRIDLNVFAAMPAALADGHALRKGGSPYRVFAIDQCGVGDNEAEFSALARIPLAGPAGQRQFFTSDYSRRLLAVVHRFGPTGEVELVVVNQGLTITRSVLRNIGDWIFVRMGQRRLLARIRSDDTRSQELARRAGFVFEGTARKFFADDLDAALWAMTAAECPWLR